MTGGTLRGSNYGLVGSGAEQSLQGLRVSRAFLSGAGLTAERGLSTSNMLSASVDRALVQAAAEVVVLADHTKLGADTMFQTVPTDLHHPSGDGRAAARRRAGGHRTAGARRPRGAGRGGPAGRAAVRRGGPSAGRRGAAVRAAHRDRLPRAAPAAARRPAGPAPSRPRAAAGGHPPPLSAGARRRLGEAARSAGRGPGAAGNRNGGRPCTGPRGHLPAAAGEEPPDEPLRAVTAGGRLLSVVLPEGGARRRCGPRVRMPSTASDIRRLNSPRSSGLFSAAMHDRVGQLEQVADLGVLADRARDAGRVRSSVAARRAQPRLAGGHPGVRRLHDGGGEPAVGRGVHGDRAQPPGERVGRVVGGQQLFARCGERCRVPARRRRSSARSGRGSAGRGCRCRPRRAGRCPPARHPCRAR